MDELPIDLPVRRQIAEAMFGTIDEKGYCRCPGADLHTNKSGPNRDRPGRDCRVYLEKSERNPRGVPSVKCVHSSCEGVISQANHQLRSEIAKHEARKAKDEGYEMPAPKRKKRTREEIEREKADRLRSGLAIRSELAMSRIVVEEWERSDMWEESDTIPEDALGQARALLGLFKAGDMVWCGEHKDSISLEDQKDAKQKERLARVRAARPFRRALEWIEGEDLPGPRICPSAFKAGMLARSNESVQARRFLVIEHDHVSLAQQSALLRWLWRDCKMPLRAIVFTGGKSLHGWFECPPPVALEELQVMLCGFRRPGEKPLGGMGFDPATFVPSQAYRLPGWPHDKTGNLAELWFLK
jgi:hypothetical protein